MVQSISDQNEDEAGNTCRLNIVPLVGVDLNDAVAHLRSRGDSSDDIFEIKPRFCISPIEGSAKTRIENGERILETYGAAGGNDVTGIAVGQELVVFEKDKDEPAKQLHFSARIDFVVWRRSILLIGLASSEIILVDPSSYDIKHSWKLRNDLSGDKRFFVDAYIHSNPDPTKIDVIVVSLCGLVCKFPDVSLSVGTLDCTQDQNVSLDIDLATVKDLSWNLEISSTVVCASSPTRNKLVLVEECGRVVIVELNDRSTDLPRVFVNRNLFSNCVSLTKISNVTPKKITAFDGLVFILLSNGRLEIAIGGNMFESESLKLPSELMIVHDFALVLNSEGKVKLWTLLGSQLSSSCENYVGIFSGPKFSVDFIFKIPEIGSESQESRSYKFPRHVSSFEEPFSIIEATSDNIRLYHMLETSTDVTLQKLLSRGKYSDAEELALHYKKDLDIVKKAKARDLLNKLTSTAGVASDASYKELLDVLKSIQDAQFVCNFCVHSQLPKVEWVKEILGIGKTRVSECSQTKDASLLLLTMKKFYTFELVYPNGTINDWSSLISEENTMFLQSIRFLQNGNFDKCEKIWKRHYEEFVPSITLKDFLPFFNILFDHQLKTLESISLLKTILPFTVEKVAQSEIPGQSICEMDVGSVQLNVLLAIILRQVSTLEGKVDWPMNALKFVNVLSSVVHDEIRRFELARTMDSLFKTKQTILKKISDNLYNLKQVLEELTDLKTGHSIRIWFKDYTENDIPEVINNLLYNLLRSDEVERFVSSFLRPYAARKNLNVDFLFAEHIKSVLQDIPYFIQAINIPHEERIICLVNLISSPKMKLQCTKRISEEWPVPWTSGIDNMVKLILDSFPRTSLDPECMCLYNDIASLRKQVPFRCVLNKYKLTATKILQRRSYATMALLRILRLQKPGFCEDCKELLKNIPGVMDVRLEYLEFVLQMYNTEVSEEQIFSDRLYRNPQFKKSIIRRIFLELQRFESIEEDLQLSYSLEEQERFFSIYKLVTADSNDPTANVIANLKREFPVLPLDIVHHHEYPYAIIAYLMNGSNILEKLINDCKRLGRITETYYPDILLAVGAYLTQPGFTGNPMQILWNIVEHVVKTPLHMDVNNSSDNGDLIQNACLRIATTLLEQCPSLTLEQMDILQEFLGRMSGSFDELCENIGQLFCYFRIFLSLKEQEIPLEHEFLEVYKWLYGTGLKWDNIKPKLVKIGEILLKFGEMELYNSVFRSIVRDLMVVEDVTYCNYYKEIVREISVIKDDLLSAKHVITEDETDSTLRKLVEDLNNSGLRMNAYALKMRNKVKLLERLLNMKNFILASELAITFNFYENHNVWSKILQGFIASEKRDELRRVLESIRTVTQLWMLPEFAEAWKRVSEVDIDFYDMCPIPLE